MKESSILPQNAKYQMTVKIIAKKFDKGRIIIIYTVRKNVFIWKKRINSATKYKIYLQIERNKYKRLARVDGEILITLQF